jgi:hypothetical protein
MGAASSPLLSMSRPASQRFDIPSRATIIEGFRAMRDVLEAAVQARGNQLDPAWYDDGPEACPWLWKDQLQLLKQTRTKAEPI